MEDVCLTLGVYTRFYKTTALDWETAKTSCGKPSSSIEPESWDGLPTQRLCQILTGSKARHASTLTTSTRSQLITSGRYLWYLRQLALPPIVLMHWMELNPVPLSSSLNAVRGQQLPMWLCLNERYRKLYFLPLPAYQALGSGSRSFHKKHFISNFQEAHLL